MSNFFARDPSTSLQEQRAMVIIPVSNDNNGRLLFEDKVSRNSIDVQKYIIQTRVYKFLF